MIVSGTPDALKALPAVNRPGRRRIEVETARTARALAWLQQQPFCESATIFGQCVHALVDAKVSDADLLAEMHAVGFDNAQIREITASLEDVFVTLTEQQALARTEAPPGPQAVPQPQSA
jgi:hypothetical protein